MPQKRDTMLVAHWLCRCFLPSYILMLFSNLYLLNNVPKFLKFFLTLMICLGYIKEIMQLDVNVQHMVMTAIQMGDIMSQSQ